LVTSRSSRWPKLSKAAESANLLLHAIHFRPLLNFARAIVRAQHDSGANCRQTGSERSSTTCDRTASVHKGFYPTLSQYAARCAQTVQSEPPLQMTERVFYRFVGWFFDIPLERFGNEVLCSEPHGQRQRQDNSTKKNAESKLNDAGSNSQVF